MQMGYGGRALELLHQYYEFKFPPLDDLPDPADTQIEPVTGTLRCHRSSVSEDEVQG